MSKLGRGLGKPWASDDRTSAVIGRYWKITRAVLEKGKWFHGYKELQTFVPWLVEEIDWYIKK